MFMDKVMGDNESTQQFNEEVTAFCCPICGAVNVMEAVSAMGASCAWCKQFFTIAEQQNAGIMPDLVLPFKVSRQEAIKKAHDQTFFRPKEYFDENFLNNFAVEDVRGIYIPYQVAEESVHVAMNGVGEREARNNSSDTQLSSAKEYQIGQEFDLLVKGLMIECLGKRLTPEAGIDYNNLIEDLAPFDIENAVPWENGYLHKNVMVAIDEENQPVESAARLIVQGLARQQASAMADGMNRVEWNEEKIDTVKQTLKTVCLPIWLCSYRDTVTGRLYYIAVNGRSGDFTGLLPKADVYKNKNTIGSAAAIGMIALGSALLAIGFADTENLLFGVASGISAIAAGCAVLVYAQTHTEVKTIVPETVGVKRETAVEIRHEILDIHKTEKYLREKQFMKQDNSGEEQ